MSQLPDFSEESQTQNVDLIVGESPLTVNQPTPGDVGQGGEFFSLPFIPVEETPVDQGCTGSLQEGLGEKASGAISDSKRCSARKDSVSDIGDDCLIVACSSATTAAVHSSKETVSGVSPSNTCSPMSAVPQSDMRVADASKESPSGALNDSLSSGEQKKPGGKGMYM